MKRILITAGATRTYLDDIRFISNNATGTLASYIALQAINKKMHVTFIHGKESIVPYTNSKLLKLIEIETVEDLVKVINKELKNKKYDAFVHTIGVTDYIPIKKIKGKISSNSKFLTIKLKKCPKIINIIKKISLFTYTIGCKLESNVTNETLIKRAKELMKKSKANLVIANDYKSVKKGTHAAFIISKDKIEFTTGKLNIAKSIIDKIQELWE